LGLVQQNAIKHAEEQAYRDCGDKVRQLKTKIKSLTGSDAAFDNLWSWMAHHVPIIIQVKLGQKADLRYMVDLFMADSEKLYRNMFELAAGAGRGSKDKGARGEWEKRMFGVEYHNKVNNEERPKYGCLNLTDDPKGVPNATQYGTSYLVLKPSVRWRCTFTSRDSCHDASQLATSRQCAKFLAECSDAELLKIWRHNGETIADYREVQIHGTVCFSRDVAKLVVDKDLPASVKSKARAWGSRDGFSVEEKEVHATQKSSTSDGGPM